MYVYIYICPDFGSGTVFIYAIIFFLKHVQYRYSRLAISFPDGRLKPPSKSNQQKPINWGRTWPTLFDILWFLIAMDIDPFYCQIWIHTICPYIYISEAIVKHMLDVLPMSDLHAHCRGRVTGGWSVCPPWRGCHVFTPAPLLIGAGAGNFGWWRVDAKLTDTVSYPCVFLSHLETLGYFKLCGSLSVPTMMKFSRSAAHLVVTLGLQWNSPAMSWLEIHLQLCGFHRRSSQQQWSASSIDTLCTYMDYSMYLCIYWISLIYDLPDLSFFGTDSGFAVAIQVQIRYFVKLVVDMYIIYII
jgi:hypothetical protein